MRGWEDEKVERIVKGSEEMGQDRWRTLEVWKLADDFAFCVYDATRRFPKEEMFGITSQVRRAALSVPTNLVEGYSRKGDKELSHFVNICLGSLAEAKYLLTFAFRLRYLPEEQYKDLIEKAEHLGKLLWGFYRKVRG